MALTFPEFFGGEAGITTNRVIRAGFVIGAITYGPQIQVYYLIAVWLRHLCCRADVRFHAARRLGRHRSMPCATIPERAEFIGYNTQRVRYLVALILVEFFCRHCAAA